MSNPLRPLLEVIPPAFRNRYILAMTAFFFWMIFIDKHDALTQWRLQRTVNKLEAEKAYYQKKIEQAERDRQNLQINGEKFARERYFMKKRGEDVFIIEEEQ